MRLKIWIKIFISNIFIFTVGYSFAQNTFQREFYTPYTTAFHYDKASYTQQTTDGGYIVFGHNNGFEALIIKLNSCGDIQWSKKYSSNGVAVSDGKQTADGGYIISGTDNILADTSKIFLSKTDSNGNLLWTKNYMDDGGAEGTHVRETSDGGFIIVGFIHSLGYVEKDVYLIKTDAFGNLQWSRKFGGSDDDYGMSVRQTIDGGYIVSGITYSFSGCIYLIKTDISGNLQWSKTFNIPSPIGPVDVIQVTDGGFILTGSHEWSINNHDVFLLKTDSLGGFLWCKNYNLNNTSGNAGFSLMESTNKNIIVTGGQKNSNSMSFILKTDSVGNVLWEKVYTGISGMLNGTDSESINQTQDDGFIIVGRNEIGSSQQIYLVKTDSLGNSGCLDSLITPTIINSFPAVANPLTIVGAGATESNPIITVTNYVITDSLLCGPISLIANAGPDTTICSGDSITLNASGGTSYSWFPSVGLNNPNSSNPSASPVITTTYTVVVSNANACEGIDSVTVYVSPNPTAIAWSNTTICVGDSITLNASGGTSYSWAPSGGLNSSNSPNPSASPVITTTYTVVVSNANGCEGIDSVTVYVSPNPTALLWSNLTITAGSSTTLSASGGTNYSWDNGAITDTTTVSPEETTVYCVIITDTNGCTDTACVTVLIEDSCGTSVYIPNAFTPNNNDLNDVFKPIISCVHDYRFLIFNRWGEKVFETLNIEDGWSGFYKEKICEQGVYVYKIVFVDDTENNFHQYTGKVTLLE